MNGTIQFAKLARRLVLCAVCGAGLLVMFLETGSLADEPNARLDSNGDPLPLGAVARFGSARLRHGGALTGLQFSSDGKVLFSCSPDRTIRLWDVATGREKETLVGPTGRLRAIAVSPDGKRLAAGTESAGILIWDLVSGRVIHKISPDVEPMNDLAFSPDGKLLATSDAHNAIQFWNVETAAPVGKLRGSGGYLRIAFAADGEHIVSLGRNGSLHIWDYQNLKVVTALNAAAESMALAVSQDHQILVGNTRGQIECFELKTGKRLESLLGHQGSVLDLAFSADGKRLASASSDRTVRSWDWPNRKLRSVLKGHNGEVLSVAVSPDGKIIASGGGKLRWNSDNTIRLWNANSGQELPQDNPFSGRVTSVSYSADGNILATGTEDKRIQLWDTRSGKLLDRWRIGESTGPVKVGFTPDSKNIACAGQNVLFLTKVEDSDKTITLGGGDSSTFSVAVSPDGKSLASGNGAGLVEIWDIPTEKLKFRFQDHNSYTLSIAFSPNGEFLASTAWDGTLCLRDTKSGTLLFKQKLHSEYGRAVAFSPDGRLIASASDDKSICLVEVDSGKEVSRLRCVNGVTSIAFHPNCRTLISGHWSNQINVWDIASGERIKQFHAPPGIATGAVACSVDGKHFVAGLTDCSTVVWDLESVLRAPLPYRLPMGPPADLKTFWTSLASQNPSKAEEAYWLFATSDQDVVEFMAQRLIPSDPAALEEVPALIKQLDDAEFGIREQASTELGKMGSEVKPLLEKALSETDSVEVEGRLKRILAKLFVDGTVPFVEVELLRKARAIHLLGQLGTPESKSLLEELAESPDTLLSQRAQTVLALPVFPSRSND